MTHLPPLSPARPFHLIAALSAGCYVAWPQANARSGEDRQRETAADPAYRAASPSRTNGAQTSGEVPNPTFHPITEPLGVAPPPSGKQTGANPTASAAIWKGTMGYEMVPIPAGAYELGCTSGQTGCESDEAPRKTVLSYSFYIGRTEVTQELWQTVMGSNPSKFNTCGPTCPVEDVSWVTAAKFANALSTKDGLPPCYKIQGDDIMWNTGLACPGYRIPTEAEWEVAARGGKDTLFSGSVDLDSVAWYGENAGGTTHPVAQKAPNGYGLYDMSGNVTEWTFDKYGSTLEPSTDPIGAPYGSDRVIRGGAWYNERMDCRVSGRNASDRFNRYDMGIRLVKTIP